MPATGAFRGMPASIIASEAPQTLAMDEDPFELGDLGDDADRVGEGIRAGKHRMHCAPCELAVADFAAAGRTHAARLAHGVGREVIVQEEGLLVGALQGVDPLLVLARAERCYHERLRLAAGEQRRAVRARNHMDQAIDGPHRNQIAAVDALAGLEDARPDDVLLDLLEGVRELHLIARARLRRDQFGHSLRFRLADLVIAVLLTGNLERLLEVALAELLDLGLELVLRLGQIPRLFRRSFGQVYDCVDNRLVAFLAEDHRAEHNFFGKLLGLRFDHQHRSARASHDKVKLSVVHLVDGRVEDVLALRVTDPRRRDRPKERQTGKCQRRRRGNHRHDVGIVLHVVGEHGDDDLRLVLEARREKRPDRPVDQPGDQRLILAWAAFALEVAAGDLARRVSLFLIVDREGEEILGWIGIAIRHHRGKDRGFAILCEHRRSRLPGDAPRLKRKCAAAPFDFFPVYFEHFVLPTASAGSPSPGTFFASCIAPATSSAESRALLVGKIVDPRFPRAI